MPGKNSTVRRSLFVLVAASVLPTLVAALFVLLYAFQEEQDSFQNGLRETTRALALVVDREIARREAIAFTLSHSPTLTRNDLGAFYEYARSIAPTPDRVIVLQDLTGQQIVNTRLSFGAELPKSAISKERLAVGPLPTVVSNLYFAPVGKQFSFAVQVPVVRDGQVLYYLSYAGYASALQSILKDQNLPDGWIASILDATGKVVARNKEPEKFVGKSTSERLIAQLAAHTEGVFESTTIDGLPVLATFSKSPTYRWSVVVGVPLQVTYAPLKVVALFGALGALLLVVSVLTALAIGRRLLAPVERLKEASKALGLGGPIDPTPTGLQETDEVLAVLREANARIGVANQDLEARRTEAEAAGAAVRESEARLLQLANTIPNLAWMANADGWITWYNNRWYEYTGTTPAEMEGWGWQKVHDAETLPAVMERWTDSIKTGHPFEMTFPLLGKDGVYRPFFTRVAPLHDATGAIVQWFGTNTDVSPLKKAEDELREADRRKDEFLAMLAHELRNPLAPIRNAAELLDRLPSPDPRVAKTSQVIARQVGHMSGLLNDLLDVSRITRGLVTLDKERVDLRAVIAGAVEQVKPLIESRGHELAVSNEEPGARVLASPLRLIQVISNLLDNAAKYTEPGGRISLAVRSAGADVSIVVQDNGTGISQSLLPRIFEPFTQAERGVDRSQGGLGLGLAVVRGLVALQGGTVTAHSEGIGKGSRFEILLPLLPAADDSAAQPLEARTAGAPAQEVRNVLIVDDNVDAADTLSILLEIAGYRVRCAYNATDAVALLGQQSFDAAILDIGLPDMSGYELATRIRGEQLPAGVLIALSGYGQAQDQRASAAAGFSLHLVKPVEPDRLIQALSEALRGIPVS